MFIQQIYTKCLAQASYYIENNGEAAIVDPIRDTQIYIDLAKERNAKITYIFETHFHADFVSGHIDLANLTGAQIVFSVNATTSFNCLHVSQNQELKIGNLIIKTLLTPGHTPESACFLLKNEQNQDYALFSGDTLFVNDVGRPDLCQSNSVLTKETMAKTLFHSLHTQILPLSNSVILYPGHGPGSACGKNIGTETQSTIGNEKKHNYALQFTNETDFVNAITLDIAKPLPYFFADAALNKEGYLPLNTLISSAKGLQIADFELAVANNAIILDTRAPADFELGFIPNSINIGLNGKFAIWAASLFDLDRKIVLVTNIGEEEESIIRLARVGFENVIGYLNQGFNQWKNENKPIDMVISITPEELALDVRFGSETVLDVRNQTEWNTVHIDNAIHLNLENLIENSDQLTKNKTYLIHCAGGYRSMIACSMLKKEGFTQVKNVYGGMSKIIDTDIPLIKEQVTQTA